MLPLSVSSSGTTSLSHRSTATVGGGLCWLNTGTR